MESLRVKRIIAPPRLGCKYGLGCQQYRLENFPAALDAVIVPFRIVRG